MARDRMGALGLALLLTLLLLGSAGAQTSPGHELSWHVVAAGRRAMAAGGYQVNGTLGQFAIGPAAAPPYALGSGYWYGVGGAGPPITYGVYVPLIFKGTTR